MRGAQLIRCSAHAVPFFRSLCHPFPHPAVPALCPLCLPSALHPVTPPSHLSSTMARSLSRHSLSLLLLSFSSFAFPAVPSISLPLFPSHSAVIRPPYRSFHLPAPVSFSLCRHSPSLPFLPSPCLCFLISLPSFHLPALPYISLPLFPSLSVAIPSP
ncbi:unnamed protein product [Closterium sp. NIES-53]